MKRLIQKVNKGTIEQIIKEILWIIQLGKKYIWAMGLFVLLGLLGVGATLGSGILSKNVIDIVTGFRKGDVIFVASIYASVQLVKIIFSAISSRISTEVQLNVNHQIRADIYSRIMKASWEPLSKFRTGDLLSRMGRDAEVVSSSVIGLVPSLIVSFLQFAGAFFLMMYYDVTLAFLSLASAPITIFSSAFLMKKLRKYSQRMRMISSDMTSFHAETFYNIQSIKSFGAVDTYCEKLKEKQERQKKAVLEHNIFSVVISSLLSTIGIVIAGVIFFFCVYRLWEGQITYGEMTLFLYLSITLGGSFKGLVSLAPAGIHAATSAGRIMEITELPAESSEILPEVKEILKQGKCSVQLKVDGVRFNYASGTNVFTDASFKAEMGQIIGLIGESGGGKTTMLRILLGLVDPIKGEVKIRDDISGKEFLVSSATRKLFSYVPQENTLFSGTIVENLRIMSPNAVEEEIQEVLKVVCAEGFVNSLPDGIYTVVGEGGVGLSEGQVQRLSIARALLSDAPILLFDESTSALDMKTQKDLLKNISKYHKQRICIVTTHRATVIESCDRVYHIKNKTIKELNKADIHKFLLGK